MTPKRVPIKGVKTKIIFRSVITAFETSWLRNSNIKPNER